MTAIAVHFGVAELAIERAQSADSKLAKTRIGVFSWVASLFMGFATNQVNKQARELANLAVWFKGAKAELAVEREDGGHHAPDELIAALEKVEGHLLDGRERMLNLVSRGGGTAVDDSFVAAVKTYSAAAADFYEALMQFKWAAMETDADFDIRSDRLKSFHSIDELMADLRS